MSIFLKNISFHGILLDALFEEGNEDWKGVAKLVSNGIKSGAVKPLRTTVFDKINVEHAFRFMAQGKHIGKVLIKVGNSLGFDLTRLADDKYLKILVSSSTLS